MKKSLLIVVDERRMGGVSILLEDMLNLGVFSDYDTDILVLHNNGTRLEDVNANVIYGTKFFNTIDLTIKEVLKTKKINLIFSKVRLVFDMKTGLIKKRIVRERKKILNKRYDVEIAFKDGFTAIFTAFGDSLKKIHWLHYEYGQSNPNIKYNKLFNELLPKFDKIIAVSEGVKKAFCDFYKINDVEVIPNIVNVQKIKDLSQKNSLIKYEPGKLNVVLVGRIHPVKGYDRFLNVVKRLYDEAQKYLNTTYASEARCVGSDPADPDWDTETDEAEYFTRNEGDEDYYSYMKNYYGTFKDIDDKYDKDWTQMGTIEGIKPVSDYYWLASRNVISNSSSSGFGVRAGNTSGSLSINILCYVYSSGSSDNNSFADGFRPVFTLKSDIKITEGDGVDTPYRLES